MKSINVSCDFLQHFASGTLVQGTEGVSNNATGEMTPYAKGEGLSAEMHTYYSDYLIDNAEPYLAHDLFAQKHRIPKGAKTISFRKYDPLPKRMTPITEGIPHMSLTVPVRYRHPEKAGAVQCQIKGIAGLP